MNENGEEMLFITDYDRHQVFKTTLEGRVVLTLSAPFECGAFARAEQYKPTDVIVSPNGDFYVLDGYGTSLILHYTAGGEFKNAFGGRGKGEENVNEVHGGTIDPRDPQIPRCWSHPARTAFSSDSVWKANTWNRLRCRTRCRAT